MVSFIVAESAIFTIFVVAYIFYLGKSLSGPTPREVLEVPIFYTICLLSSSLTIHLAGTPSERNEERRFIVFWFMTIGLGSDLSVRHGAGMVPTDLRARADDLHEPLRHDLLFARRAARLSRDASAW